jgi:hypothetical protein
MEAPYLSPSLQVLAKSPPSNGEARMALCHASSSFRGRRWVLRCRCRDIHSAMQLV